MIQEGPVRVASASRLLIAASLAVLTTGSAPAGPTRRDVSARARAIGTDRPQDEPARTIVTDPGRSRLKSPAFVLGLEKARRTTIGCPPGRGLETGRAPKAVRDQIRRTFHETPLALDGLFVSHIAEFVPTPDPSVFAPALLYDAYREADPPAPGDVFASGRRATLALGARLKAIAAERAVAGRPVSHLIVFIAGWHTPQWKTLAQMDELSGSIAAAAAGDAGYSPIFIGVSWPSFSDEIAGHIKEGVEILSGVAGRRLERADPDGRAAELARGLEKVSGLLDHPGIADKLGYLGYPTISKDADEVGMVAVSTLVNQVLIPARATMAGRPRVVVIGHSFGARAASWTPFTAPMLPGVEGVAAASAGPDLVIGLQGAFPAARFDATVRHRRPYVEGAPFADHAAFRTAFAYTCARDPLLRQARIFDVMIGDLRAYERARARSVPAFATCRARDLPAALAGLDPSRQALLIDASGLIAGHDDVRNEKVGRLVWTLMKGPGPP